MFKGNFQGERDRPDSKLQAVFSKLTGVFPRAGDLGAGVNNKTMSSDIIESVLADTPIPVPQRKFNFVNIYFSLRYFLFKYNKKNSAIITTKKCNNFEF